MFVFGGYIDMRGASDELWQYEFGECSDSIVNFSRPHNRPQELQLALRAHSRFFVVSPQSFREQECTVLYRLSTKRARPFCSSHQFENCYKLTLYDGCVFLFCADTSKWIRIKWKGDGPSPRYSHSAAVGAAGMWVYGGLEGLQARNDLWRWSFGM